MNQEERRQYGRIRLLNIECDQPYDWDVEDATHIRVCLPASYENSREMRLRGFAWVDRKGETIGFLALTEDEERKFVHLAAARDCKAAGVRALNGRISNGNPAAMNLYAFLAGAFSSPADVYLKEV